MIKPPVSVVVVSRQRPDALKLCLSAVARLSYPDFEVIVVADPAGLRVVEDLPFASQIKTVPFDEANIAAARNRGIVQAAGQIVAFLDDDAIPEPRWLDHLTSVFADPAVAAAGGDILGRNGIIPQRRSCAVDQTGETRTLLLHLRNPTILTPPQGQAVKTQGTNMAVRRDVLSQLGGFDPAFHVSLDETDLNMRLAELEYSTAFVPQALVHHGFAGNSHRWSDRTVKGLHQFAASLMVFLRKHCPPSRHELALGKAFQEERKQILGQMVNGLLEPRDIRRLLRSWRDGVEEGRTRVLTDPVPLPPAQSDYLKFQTLFRADSRIIVGYHMQAKRRRAEAAKAAAEGQSVSLFLFSYSTRDHHVRFHPDGYWEQTGGLWGRSDRSDPYLRAWNIRDRVDHEVQRIGASRF